MKVDASSTVRFARPSALPYRIVDGRAVIIQPASADRPPILATLNATGTLIWEWLDGQTTIAQVLERLAARYPTMSAGRRTSETLAFLQQLVDSGLVRSVAEEQP